jgi:CPA1 family monovalent cation:H+ antiporter
VQRPGEEVVRLGTGDFFGEMALIMRQPRVADVVALSYCRLLMLPREAFRQFLRTHPELMQQVRRSAEERLRQMHVTEEALAEA